MDRTYTDPGTTASDNAASALTKDTTGTVDMGLHWNLYPRH